MGGMEKNHFARKVIPRKKKENLLISIYTRAADSRILRSGGKRAIGEFPQGQMPQFLFLWALVLKNIAISIPLLY